MIDERGSDGEPAIDHCRRRGRDPGFVKIGDDLGVDGMGVIGTVPKADDIELNRRHKLQSGIGQNPFFEIARQSTGSCHHSPE